MTTWGRSHPVVFPQGKWGLRPALPLILSKTSHHPEERVTTTGPSTQSERIAPLSLPLDARSSQHVKLDNPDFTLLIFPTRVCSPSCPSLTINQLAVALFSCAIASTPSAPSIPWVKEVCLPRSDRFVVVSDRPPHLSTVAAAL